MVGYWNAPEQTAGVLDEAGWMHTGDLAVMDDDGYVSIVGRIKDMVIRGGENVYPREIEEFLHGHPDIVDVHVVGVPDQRYGEELCACVRLRDDATLDAAAIRAFCDGRLAHYKIPRYVITMSEFPMTVNGKLDRDKLPSPGATAAETAAGAGAASARVHPSRRMMRSIVRGVI
jgi:fatty-acyl-CoA synthase